MKPATGWGMRLFAIVAASGLAAAASAGTISIGGVVANPASAPRYAKVELTVALADVAATKLYEPDPARGGLDLSATFTSPSSATWSIKGFYDGASWLVRFAPNETGTWSYSVVASDPSGASNTATGTFECVASSLRGWAQIDGRTLRFTSGQVVFGVGHNTGWQDGPQGVEQPSFAAMAAKGENLLSFWLAAPWDLPSWGPERAARSAIENSEGGIGNYNQAACAYLDGVVARAEAAGVCVLPTSWSHGQLRDVGHPWGEGWWANNAYNSLGSATAFFQTGTSEQWRYQRNFYRYLIARYGYSRALAGWVGICEIDGTTGWVANPSQATAWCAAVRDYFRANDPFRRSAASKTPVAGTKLNSASWEAGFDLRSTDNYTQQSNNIAVAAAIASDTQTFWSSGKPGFHAEFGGYVPGGATQPAHLHNGIWAGAANGAAMTPLVWCDGGSYPMLDGAMQDHLQYLAQFMADVDYLGYPALGAASVTVNDANCRGWGMKLADRGYAWIQRTSAGSLGGQTVSIGGLATGHYTVAWFDAWTSGSNAIQTAPALVSSDGVLRATIPVLARADIALKFVGSGNGVPTAANDAYTVTEDNPLTVAAPGVLANDADPEGDPLTAVLVASPAHGAVTLNANGSFTYTPSPNYNGADSFTYKANDGMANSNVATVAITIGAVNDPPVASSDSYTTDQNKALTVAAPGVLANDSDADSNPLTAILATGPAHGAVGLNANGSFTYTPTTGYSGTDSFTYQAYDGTTLSNVTLVTITVRPVAVAVLSISMSKSTYSGYWKATAAVTVKTSTGSAISGATVTGHWSGVASGTATGTTSSKGAVSFTSASIRTSGTATFTVDTVTKNGTTCTLTGQTSGSITGAPR